MDGFHTTERCSDMKIMIVEDEPTSMMIMQKILSPYGEVFVCEDGAQALGAFMKAHDEGRPFDLICMDFMMPEMDGRDTLLKIREHENGLKTASRRRVKVAMITGLSTIESEYNDIATLSDAVIQKPVRRSELEATLERFGFKGTT
jgi:two-component system chemotaxis response regulator CheY